MKAGMSAIRPWLSCQYNKNTLVDLPSSVVYTYLRQQSQDYDDPATERSLKCPCQKNLPYFNQ